MSSILAYTLISCLGVSGLRLEGGGDTALLVSARLSSWLLA